MEQKFNNSISSKVQNFQLNVMVFISEWSWLSCHHMMIGGHWKEGSL